MVAGDRIETYRKPSCNSIQRSPTVSFDNIDGPATACDPSSTSRSDRVRIVAWIGKSPAGRLTMGGPDRLVKCVCPLDCPDTCAMDVEVRDGVAIALRGDRDHPFTRGALCGKMANYLDHVYRD